MRVTRVLVLLPASPDHPFTNSLHPSHSSILHTPLTHLFPPPSLRPMLSHGLITPLFSDSLLPLSPSLPVSTSTLPFPILSRLFSSPLLWGLSFTLSNSRVPSLSPRWPLVVHNPSDANGPHLEAAFPHNNPSGMMRQVAHSRFEGGMRLPQTAAVVPSNDRGWGVDLGKVVAAE